MRIRRREGGFGREREGDREKRGTLRRRKGRG
jgi:hypothetical protein